MLAYPGIMHEASPTLSRSGVYSCLILRILLHSKRPVTFTSSIYRCGGYAATRLAVPIYSSYSERVQFLPTLPVPANPI
jgi:hypothetical protein